MMRLNQDEHPNNNNGPQCIHCGQHYNHFDYYLSGYCSVECKEEWLQEADKKDKN